MFDLVVFFSSVTSFLLPFRWEYIVVSFDLLSPETGPLLPTSIVISSQVNPVDCISFRNEQYLFSFLWADFSKFDSKHTVSSMSMAILCGQFIMTMSGIWVVTQMSLGTVEIPHLLLWPGRSEWMIQSVSLRRFCARVNMWQRKLLCLQVYLPSFNIVGQLLEVCSSVSWCEHDSHLKLDLFPHRMRLLFVGRTELSKNCTVFLGKLNMYDFHVVSESSNSSSLKKWPWHNKVLIWDIHVSFISSLIDLVIFLFFTFGKFWTVRYTVSVTCFSLFLQYITVENFLCHTTSHLTLLSRAVLTLSSDLMQDKVWAVVCDCKYSEWMVGISVNGGICSTPGMAQWSNPTHDLRNCVYLASSLSTFVFVSSCTVRINLHAGRRYFL